DITEALASNSPSVPIGIKEADHSLGLFERLNQSVQKDSVKTTVAKFDATLMMFVEGVHRLLLWGQIPGAYRSGHLYDINELWKQGGYQGRSPCLVSCGREARRIAKGWKGCRISKE